MVNTGLKDVDVLYFLAIIKTEGSSTKLKIFIDGSCVRYSVTRCRTEDLLLTREMVY